MPSRIEHQASLPAGAGAVYSVLVDPVFLADRLDAIGGADAALVDHGESPDGVAFRLRQGLPAARLPSAVRSLLNGDLVVTRDETWRAEPAGGYRGTVRATIPGVPGEITGGMRLVDAGDCGSELVISAQVRVGIPFVGGKLEGLIAEQVGKLLAGEAEFTEKWLANRDT